MNTTEVNLSQYADDRTVLLSDVQSVSNFFDLLSLFQRCFGLKINQTKPEMIMETPKDFSKKERKGKELYLSV